MQVGVLNGNGKLICHGLQCRNIFIMKCSFLCGLDGQRPDDIFAHNKRQRHLRTSLREVGILKENRFSPNVQCDAPLTIGNARTDHRVPTNGKPMPGVDHLPARFAASRFQDSILLRIIQKEHTCVIKAKFIADDVHGALKQIIRIENGGDVFRSARRSFQQRCVSVNIVCHKFLFL